MLIKKEIKPLNAVSYRLFTQKGIKKESNNEKAVNDINFYQNCVKLQFY